MTAHHSYSCNLCHNNVVEGSGVGIVFGANRTMRMTVPSGAHQIHICQECITAFEAALTDQRSHQKIRGELSDAVIIELARTARD